MFPISAKKCEKCKTFSAFSHWNFANSGVFSPAKNRRFCFLPKIVDSCGLRRFALVCRTNCGENLQNSDEGPFFLEITLKPDKKDKKIFGIFTLSLGRLHYFQHFRIRWKLRGNTGCAIVAKCVVIFWQSWWENSFSFTLNGFTVACISWAKLPFPWSLVFSSVFPLGGFSSANQRFIGARANNFWQYGTHCFRKFKN